MTFSIKVILLFVIGTLTPNVSLAQSSQGPAINLSVKPGEVVRVTRHYVVGTYCGFDGPSITAFQSPKLGTLNSQKTKEKIPQNTKLWGDGHSGCDKETGVTYLFYKAGDVAGIDTFDIVIQFGNSTRFQKVTINVNASAKSTAKNNISANEKDKKPVQTQAPTRVPKTNEMPPTNQYFSNLRVGSTYQYEVTNEITKAKNISTVVITEKTDRDFSASTNNGSLTVMNSLFEQIETPIWKSNNRSCDGIIAPLKLGIKSEFSFNSEHIEKNSKQTFEKVCNREISYQGIITIQEKEHNVFMSKNRASYSVNRKAIRTDVFNAEFSPDISFWTYILIESRVNDRLIDKRSYKLRAYALGEENFTLYSQLCSKQCEVKEGNSIDLTIVKENYNSQEMCELDKEKRSPLIMANANSIGRYVAIFCAKKSDLHLGTKKQ